MATLAEQVVALSKNQVKMGVTENPIGSNKVKYNRYFDVEAWRFFNTKKQGAEWCCTYVIWNIDQVLKHILGSDDKVRQWFGFPKPQYNEAAGCKQFHDYMKAKDWEVGRKEGKPGDIIFFNTKKASCGHVGLIVGVKGDIYITNEGNSGNKVAEHSYSMSSSTIHSIFHPDYESVEPQPTPPEPTPTPTYKEYKVSVRSFLAVRTKPNANGDKVGELYNNAIVTVFEENNNWGRITATKDSWVYMGYLKEV